jgi:6-phosphogluconolactonase
LAIRPEHIDWARTEIYFGDERCVGPDDAESNYRMAREVLLSAVAIPENQIHRMRGELEPHEAAHEYNRLLREKFPEGTAADLTLLGMGDDGHTASLFPGTAALSEMEKDCVANHVEKLNAWRLTMTAAFLNRSRAVMVLVSGSGKASRLREVLQGAQEPTRLPIQCIRPATGQLTWLLDQPAAAML